MHRSICECHNNIVKQWNKLTKMMWRQGTCYHLSLFAKFMLFDNHNIKFEFLIRNKINLISKLVINANGSKPLKIPKDWIIKRLIEGLGGESM